MHTSASIRPHRPILPAAHLALLVGLAATTGCMFSPVSGQILPDRTNSVGFSFYATGPSKPITVDCAPGYTNTFTHIFSVTSGSSPWTYNGETVYAVSTSQVIPDHCWYFVHGRWMTKIRPKQEGYSMKVYSAEGTECIGEQLNDGKGPITAGNTCALTYSNSTQHQPYILLYADP